MAAGPKPGGSPRQASERLQALAAGDDVNPVAYFQPADEREHLVGGEVERVKDETELRMLDEREEAERTVTRPFHQHRFAGGAHLRLDIGGPLTHDPDVYAVRFEQAPVGVPARDDGGVGVMKDVDIAGNPRASQELVERCAARHVAVRRRDPILRYERADSALECCESHWRMVAART